MGLFDRFKKNKPVFNKVGLCLGGGGARGYAHIGVLKAFEEENIDFELCVGTSVGSLIGALYCAGVTADEMREIGERLDMADIHNGNVFSPNDATKSIGKLVTDVIGDAKIEDFRKKFAAVAVDIELGKQVILDSGKAGAVVSASSSVPMFFRPVEINGSMLVDGGLLNNIPADVCRMLGADKVVTVDINPTRGGGTKKSGKIDVLKATLSIMGANASVNGLRLSDVIVAVDTSAYRSTSKEGYKEMMLAGYNSAKQKVAEIKKLFLSEKES